MEFHSFYLLSVTGLELSNGYPVVYTLSQIGESASYSWLSVFQVELTRLSIIEILILCYIKYYICVWLFSTHGSQSKVQILSGA